MFAISFAKYILQTFAEYIPQKYGNEMQKCKQFANSLQRLMMRIKTLWGRYSANIVRNAACSLQTVGKLPAYSLQILCKQLATILQTVCKHSANCLQILCKQLTNTLQTVCKYSANNLQILCKQLATVHTLA